MCAHWWVDFHPFSGCSRIFGQKDKGLLQSKVVGFRLLKTKFDYAQTKDAEQILFGLPADPISHDLC